MYLARQTVESVGATYAERGNQGVHANHPKYNNEVERRLDALNLNDPKLSEKIIGIQNDLRSFIENNEGIKLNDLYN